MQILRLNSAPSNSFAIPFSSHRPSKALPRPCRSQIRATIVPEETPTIDFAFIGSRLLPDGNPDVAIRSSTGGQKLRNIMMDCHIDLYGPNFNDADFLVDSIFRFTPLCEDKVLFNCAGGGTCGTCIVQVVAGTELLSPRTDKEKEILNKKPKNWRLACQTVVGKQDSKGEVVIQTLPEWKIHEWD